MGNAKVLVKKGEKFFTNGLSLFVNRVNECFELPVHMHDFIEICYVWEGNGFHYIGDQTIRVTKGDLFFLPIGVPHLFRPSSSNPREPLTIGNCIFDENIFQFLTSILPDQYGMYRFRSLVAQSDGWLHFRERAGEFRQLFDSLYREYENKHTGYETMLCGLLLQLLIGMERSMNEEESSSSAFDRVDAITSYVREHLNEKLTLADVACEIGIGSRQLQRIVTQSMGLPFSAFLTNERIGRSCQLLDDPSKQNLTVNDVAASVGIHDPKRFYRMFKKLIGVTPTEYRAGRLLR